MPLEVTLDDLEKAAGNLGRLHDYLAARAAWTAGPETRAALEELDQALSRVAGSLAPLLAAAQVGPGESAAPGVAPKPPGVLEAVRLTRFGGFLQQLSAWLDSRSGCPAPDGGRAALASIAAAVDGAQQAVAEMFQEGPAPEQLAPPVPPPMPPPQPASAEVSVHEEAEAPAEEVALPPGGGEPLVLDPTGEVALLETRGGFTDLSPATQGLLDVFVSRNELVMNPGQRRAFGLTVRQRLEGAPEGHGLLLRVGTLRGRLEPYFTYTLLDEPEEDDKD